ncbi:MAG: glycosyltransferase [Bacteroidota bacterium]|nr:glycosyltransferase [Bacteroidota bacterium]MDP4236772.1 glycosyltransferase [Bacteroidota bacterium]
MHPFEISILIAAALYFLGLVSFLPGLLRGLRRKSDFPFATAPEVTVLVCARNEEENIAGCLESLSKLDYPSDRLEILVVDDNSTDNTSKILEEWMKRLPHLHMLSTTNVPDTGFQGKVSALILGMDRSKGEFVLITDADCTVNPKWVREHLRWFEKNTGMVSSITVLDSMKPFDVAQSLEMTELLGLSMAAINYDIPVSVIGNNLSIRKQAYQDVGGYRNIPFSVTEDVALFQTIWNSAHWKVRFKANDELLVKSEPPGNFSTWWRQKHRWVIGGKDIKLMGRIILLLGFIGAFTLIAAPLVLPLKFAGLVFLLKFSGDLVIIYPVLRGLKQLKLIWFLFVYQLYLFFFLLCVPILYVQKDVKWKGRVYHT